MINCLPHTRLHDLGYSMEFSQDDNGVWWASFVSAANEDFRVARYARQKRVPPSGLVAGGRRSRSAESRYDTQLVVVTPVTSLVAGSHELPDHWN
jgi:hypothetical protein